MERVKKNLTQCAIEAVEEEHCSGHAFLIGVIKGIISFSDMSKEERLDRIQFLLSEFDRVRGL